MRRLSPTSLAVVLAGTIPTVASAWAGTLPKACTLEDATNQIVADDIERRGRSATVERPLIEEMRAIGMKATVPNRAIGDQLTPRDAARFAEVSERFKEMQLSAFVESGHSRDADVAQRMFEMAWKTYSDPKYSPPSNDRVGGVLVIMRALFPTYQPWKPSSDSSCTVDTALAGDEAQGLQRFQDLQPVMNHNLPLLQQLRRRYGIADDGTFDSNKMQPDDYRAAQAILVSLQPSISEKNLLLDLQHIRAWWSVASLVYTTRKEDVATYASFEHLGDTLTPQIKAMPQAQQALLGLWQMVDNKVPSEEEKMLVQMSKVRAAAKGGQ